MITKLATKTLNYSIETNCVLINHQRVRVGMNPIMQPEEKSRNDVHLALTFQVTTKLLWVTMRPNSLFVKILVHQSLSGNKFNHYTIHLM